MEWSNEAILDFLDVYENEPVIWNYTSPDHKDYDQVYEAWKRIESKMEGRYSVKMLKKKRDSLMAVYRQCRHRVKACTHNGVGGDEVYKPNWFAYTKMERFLRHVNTSNQTINAANILSDDCIKKENSGPNNSATSVLLQEFEQDNQRNVLMLRSSSRKRSANDEICYIYGSLVAAKLSQMDDEIRHVCMLRIDSVLLEMRARFKKYL